VGWGGVGWGGVGWGGVGWGGVGWGGVGWGVFYYDAASHCRFQTLVELASPGGASSTEHWNPVGDLQHYRYFFLLQVITPVCLRPWGTPGS
jgi:hypothetical protein